MNQHWEVLELTEILREVSNHTRFSLGRELVLSLQPQFGRLWVERELARTKEAIALETTSGSLPLGGISDIRQPLRESLKDQTLAIGELLAVARHGQAVKTIKDYMRKAEITTPQLIEIVTAMQESIALSNEIERCFSPSYEVLDNASPELKSIRKQMRHNQTELHKTADSFIQKNSAKLTDTISTYRNDRVVVLARISDKNSFGGILHGESASGQTAYIEPPVLVELNNKSQSLKIAEEEEIKRICFVLSQTVKQWADAYLANLLTLSLLDAVFAKARWGIDHKSVIATLNTTRDLRLENARHPLIDPLKVVANTYHITQQTPTLLITGPNTGGKTVSLKILGLFTLMTYCGLALPCDDALIPMFDQVFVDIGDEQSIQQSLSTFSAHLSKLAEICDKATSKSLILLDELGGGTDPIEGESLAMATLNFLRSKKPMIAATTHYSKLKTYGTQHSDILLASVQFDMEKMQPTYRYVEGLAGQSNALAIARKFGLNPIILAQAQELKDAAKTVEEHLVEKLENAILTNQQLKENLVVKQREIESAQKELDNKLTKYEEQREKLLEDARKEAKRTIEEIQQEALQLLSDMREVQKSGKMHEAIEKKYTLDQLIQTPLSPEDESPASVEVGDWVKIRSTQQTGQVLSVKRKQVTISVNGLRMEVPLTQILNASAPKKKNVSSVHVDRPTTSSLELNIIGLRVDEALPLVDKYLDDCTRLHLTNVRIVHGHGTGALRTAVHGLLKHHSQVSEYRLGGQGEGGVGATVVTLKGSGK